MKKDIFKFEYYVPVRKRVQDGEEFLDTQVMEFHKNEAVIKALKEDRKHSHMKSFPFHRVVKVKLIELEDDEPDLEYCPKCKLPFEDDVRYDVYDGIENISYCFHCVEYILRSSYAANALQITKRRIENGISN